MNIDTKAIEGYTLTIEQPVAQWCARAKCSHTEKEKGGFSK